MGILHSLWVRWRAGRMRTLDGVPGPVHVDDQMLPSLGADPREAQAAIDAYLGAGMSALEALERALRRGERDWADLDACLDLGCGYGRVTRWLVQRLEPARVTACDVDPVAVGFCARAFDTRRLVAAIDPAACDFGRRDLVWSGSVITHLEPSVGVALLRRVVDALAPGGLFVFSFHGAFSLSVLDDYYDRAYADEADAIRREVAEQGVSYRRYPRSGRFQGAEYGMTWHDGRWLTEQLESFGDVEVLAVETQGWHHHHDVVTVRRRDG